MKLKFKNILSIGLLATAFTWTSCNDDHEVDWVISQPSDVEFVSSSINDGDVISPMNTIVELTYSTPISFNSVVPVTLNGDTLSIKADKNTKLDSIRVDGNRLIIMLPQLKGLTDYNLLVDSRVVAGIGTKTFAPEVNINFTTTKFDVEITRPINPNATAATVKVYDFLVKNAGNTILSGGMANVNNNNDFTGWIKSVTQKDVAITGYDFIHLPESGQNWINYSDITPATDQWNAGGLVSYMWHWRVPTDEQAWKDKDVNRYGCRTPGEDVDGPTNFNIENALIDGTWEHDFIIEDIAKVAEVLKQLQDKGIPVIWRPLHEAAGDYEYKNPWFWWGNKGGDATKKLWRLMYDQLVNVHGCNNLIWVWTAQYKKGYEAEMAADYPGNDVVDIIGTDIYANNDNSQVEAYLALYNLGKGEKLATISETGLVQNPDKCIADGANWSWFNIWYTYDQHVSGNDTDGFGNTITSLTNVLNSAYVTNRDGLPSFK